MQDDTDSVLVKLAERLEKVEEVQATHEATIKGLLATTRRLGDAEAERSTTAAERSTPAANSAGSPASNEKLVRWVCWLVDRYDLDGIVPTCWARHGALVEELDALRVGWLGTVAKDRDALAATQWHDQLGRALDRIEAGRWRTCTASHAPSPAESWTAHHQADSPPTDLQAERYSES